MGTMYRGFTVFFIYVKFGIKQSSCRISVFLGGGVSHSYADAVLQ